LTCEADQAQSLSVLIGRKSGLFGCCGGSCLAATGSQAENLFEWFIRVWSPPGLTDTFYPRNESVSIPRTRNTNPAFSTAMERRSKRQARPRRRYQLRWTEHPLDACCLRDGPRGADAVPRAGGALGRRSLHESGQRPVFPLSNLCRGRETQILAI